MNINLVLESLSRRGFLRGAAGVVGNVATGGWKNIIPAMQSGKNVIDELATLYGGLDELQRGAVEDFIFHYINDQWTPRESITSKHVKDGILEYNGQKVPIEAIAGSYAKMAKEGAYNFVASLTGDRPEEIDALFPGLRGQLSEYAISKHGVQSIMSNIMADDWAHDIGPGSNMFTTLELLSKNSKFVEATGITSEIVARMQTDGAGIGLLVKNGAISSEDAGILANNISETRHGRSNERDDNYNNEDDGTENSEDGIEDDAVQEPPKEDTQDNNYSDMQLANPMHQPFESRLVSKLNMILDSYNNK